MLSSSTRDTIFLSNTGSVSSVEVTSDEEESPLLSLLVLKRSQHHVSAAVFSRDSDVPVLTCSTQEWALKKQLSSTHSVAACRSVGDVLAQRCCEAGITRLFYREVPWTFRSDAVQTFWTAMREGGVLLSEPKRKFI
ncbi:39S ribosomal protein L18, mitochondrial [Tachysurus ichikawai]